MSTTPCNSGRRHDEINYEQSKKNFLKLVEDRMSNYIRYRQLYQLYTKKTIEQIIAQTIENPFSHARYKVLAQRNGKNILTKHKKLGSYSQVLSWEDMFDIFMPLHVQSGHRGKDILKREIDIYCKKNNIDFKFPTISLSYFRSACNLCVQNGGKFSQMKSFKVGVVHVIAMVQTRQDEKFRYLLIYADKETHYVVLRPLTEKSSLEISTELYKIFTQFGPPMMLHVHGYNSALTEKISTTLNEICPEFKIQTQHEPGRYELPTVVTDRIQEWMTKNKCLVWEVGCCIIQAEMNNDPLMRPSRLRNQPRCTPHSLYFHTKHELSRKVTMSAAPKINVGVIDLTDHSLKDKETQNQETKPYQTEQDQVNQNQMSQDHTTTVKQVIDQNLVTNTNPATKQRQVADETATSIVNLLESDEEMVVECNEVDSDSIHSISILSDHILE